MDFNMLKQFILGGGTPQQFLNRITVSNPMIGNLISMAQKGNTQSIEAFARNLFKEKGKDFDKEFSEFKKRLLQ